LKAEIFSFCNPPAWCKFVLVCALLATTSSKAHYSSSVARAQG